MAGTLTISTLSDGTYSTSSTNLVRAPCVAWASFNGTAGTLTAGYNVSSITKNGTGDYTLNFTNALVDANYAAVAMGNNGQVYNNMPSTRTTTQLRIVAYYQAALNDVTFQTVIVVR
jgi:hypothetical protein